MVTASQFSRLDAKLGAVTAAIDTDSQAIKVVVFQGETREFALQRHRELRPDQAGRPVRFEHRNEPRTEVAEMFAVHTPKELQAVIDRIDAKCPWQADRRADAGRCTRGRMTRITQTIAIDLRQRSVATGLLRQ